MDSRKIDMPDDMSYTSPRIYDRYGAGGNDRVQIVELSSPGEAEQNVPSNLVQSPEPPDLRGSAQLVLSPLKSSSCELLSRNHDEQESADKKTPPPLNAGSSFRSLRSSHNSLKSGRSDNSGHQSNSNSRKSGGSGGSRGSVGTMKSFQSSRNPVLEILKHDIHGVPSKSANVDSEEEEPSRPKWIALGFIGFLVILTLICAIIEVKILHVCP
jgi:hypothetical protein